MQLFLHNPDVNLEVVVRLTVSLDSPTAQQISHSLTPELHLTVNPSKLEPNLAAQIKSMTLPFHCSQPVSDPAILHLVHLLQTELQTPKIASQMFISSIVTVLTLHLLHQWEIEQDRN
jgi:hypothetical protein